MKTFFLKIIIALSLFLSSCAQIGTLTGGEKDSEPPKIVSSIPENKSINFTGEQIEIKFDEFFSTDNIEAKFISSPLLAKTPDFVIKRKKLIIKFNEKLNDSVTYSFDFGDAIKDYHEGNTLKNLKFIFSTGDFLDTMEISGNILDAQNHKPEKGMYVMLYKNFGDSLPLKQKPYYITKADSAGAFKIDYIRNGKYKLFSLIDVDANLLFNLPNEKIAFYDSILTTTVVSKTQTDSLKKGAIMHVGQSESDTLKNDTIIIQQKHFYSPADIKLFAFTEDKQKQFVSNFSRVFKQKAEFNFNKKIDSIDIKPVGFSLPPNSFIKLAPDTGKVITYWILNPDVYLNDTLKFEVNFFNKDSDERAVLEKDTIIFTYKAPQNLKDTLKTSFIKIEPEHDFFQPLTLTSETPVQDIFIEKFKLYRVIDTLVADARKQKLTKYQRLSPQTVLFEFARPLVDPLKIISQINSGNDSIKYQNSYFNDRKKVICTISDTTHIFSDTLKIIVKYDNDYFLKQVQHFTDTLKLAVLNQKLLKIEREHDDTVKLQFLKPISENIDLSIFDRKSQEVFTYKVIDNEVKIAVNDKDFKNLDTLKLSFKTFDYKNINNENIYFEENFRAMFVQKKQYIKNFGRKTQDELYMLFNDKTKIEPTLELLNIDDKEKNILSKNLFNNDSLAVKLMPDFAALNDTVLLAVTYNKSTRNNLTVNATDTLKFYITKHKKRPAHKKDLKTTESGAKLLPVKIEIPLDCKVAKDTINPFIITLSADWQFNLPYVLKTTKGAYVDYFKLESKPAEMPFKIREKDYYGKIILQISNIKRISDYDYLNIPTIAIDSTLYTKLPHGQVIVMLLDKDEKLIQKNILNRDSIINFEKLIPGKYKIKLFFDENSNGKWDTGDYLKHKQPERVLYFPDEITIISKWDNELEWKLIKK